MAPASSAAGSGGLALSGQMSKVVHAHIQPPARSVDDWGKLHGDIRAPTALLDRLLHHAHVLKCGPRSWTKMETGRRTDDMTK